MDFPRASGVLLHPTSLPGPYGIGELGDAARRFVDFLVASDQTYWQVLPLGPTGYGDSPYQCFSSFAGNPLMINLDALAADGLLDGAPLSDPPPFSPDSVDFGWVITWKFRLLHDSYLRFRESGARPLHDEFVGFCQHHAGWLDDYALFMSLKESHGGAVWTEWEPELVRRDPSALHSAKARLAETCQAHQYFQWLFFRQWAALRSHANERGVRLIGDIPIFVAHDSADVWANPHFFFLNEAGKPLVVAGVPPDYFSPTGQLWGNPLYRWDAMAASSYAWWVRRVKAALSFVDILRIDHFRGFESFWEVPSGESTAENGRWVRGPGGGLFSALRQALGHLPLIAEDLGVITPEVEALRDEFDLPGMKVLQFAFSSGPDNPHLPHNLRANTVIYTGTHDNDTTVGHFSRPESSQELAYACLYVSTEGNDIVWDLIRAAWASVAHTAIVPLQDLLCLGNEARFNYPSRPSGNWGWRYRDGVLSDYTARRLARMTAVYGRSTRGALPEPFAAQLDSALSVEETT